MCFPQTQLIELRTTNYTLKEEHAKLKAGESPPALTTVLNGGGGGGGAVNYP